ncbi:14101_t:CDS:2, partial [Dentiscutata erythropus]
PTGRPSLEEQQPGLLEAIVQIVFPDRQADERWHLEIVRSVKTLDQLQEALTHMNYNLSHSAAYLRLIPKWYSTEKESNMLKPVKLLRSQNIARRSHEDTHFCTALIRNIKEMLSLLGPKTPILMRLEYQVELPDHDWVVTERHKLIPSGQAKAVTYSGSIFIRIRSGKHDSSTAYSHGKDFDDLINEEKLHNYTTTNEQPKPVVVLISDSGSDENPRYRKTIQMMIKYFDKYNLNTIIVKDTIIDNYPVLVKYIDPPNEHYSPSEKSATWIEKHVMTCHYVTQVVKYDDPSCFQQTPYNICAAKINEFDNTTHFSSFLLSVLMERKLTSPDMNLRYLSFDWYCPTVNKSINEYICFYCNRYFALKRTLKNHTRKYSHKESNLFIEAALDTQEFPVVYVHNYHHGEFLVSNKSSETMWVEEEAVPEDVLETYNQQVQVQEELVADKVLIVN